MQNNNPTLGIYYLAEGFKLILKPGLKRFVIIPLIINIILFASLFFLMQHFFSEFNHWIISHLPSWLQWLGSILWIVFFLGFFLVIIYTFVTLANLICAPFNSFLAEKVEYLLIGTKHEASTWQTIKNIPRIIKRQLAILGYYLPRAVLLFILFFIPVVQLIAAVLWFLFNGWFMTLTYIDYPTDINHIPLTKVREQMQQKRWISLSFGSSVLLLTMIPIVNFFVIPAAVAGATKFWIKEFR